MKRQALLWTVILFSIVIPVLECLAIGGGDTEVYIDAKYKTGFTVAPNPEYTQAAQRQGEHGQGIYRLTIDPKDGSVAEVKILIHAGRNLDASAVFTFLKWKTKPGTWRQQDVSVDFHMTRFLRQTR